MKLTKLDRFAAATNFSFYQTNAPGFVFPRAVTGKMREIPANMLKQLHRRLMAQKKERQRERERKERQRENGFSNMEKEEKGL